MSIRRNALLTCAAIGFSIGAWTPSVNAQTITVSTTEDVVDFGGAQQVVNLPGPDGVVSFREACTAANNTAGPQTIAFAIPNAPPNEWNSGVATLFMDFDIFQLTDDATTVDFTTQTAFTGNTNPNGNEVGIRTAPITGAPAIYVSADHCTIKGLDRVDYCGYGVELTGNFNRVIGCTIQGPLYAAVYITGGFGGPPATGNVVGGTGPGEGNTLSSGNDGVRIDGPADDNVVIGNVLTGSFHGAAVRGSDFTPLPNDNRIGGPTPAERNLIAGAGNYGEEGFPDGAQVKVEQANRTIVEGNYIGTTADGSAPFPNQRGPVGVEVIDSTGTIVRRNLISGIRVVGVNHYAGQLFGDGIRVTTINGPTSNTFIEDNRIGTDPTGQSPVPNLYGVRVVPLISSEPTTETGLFSNTVAFNERAGIVVAQSVSGVRISETSTAGNGQLGIDLLAPGGGSGVTPNDPLDGDNGANGLQNFPVLASATLEGAVIRVAGSLNSTPQSDFTIELFASPDCDPSGFGEGKVFLGATGVSTNASGNAGFEVLVPATVPAGWFVTATATSEPTGSTSELCACVALSGQGIATYCTAGTSASGCQASMSAAGVPSASAPSGFSLLATGVEGNKNGLFFFGTNGRQANPWGNGTSYQCVVPPVERTPLMPGTGTVGSCDGSLALDLNALWCPTCPKPQKNPGPGAVVQAQLWYRDPASTSNQPTSLSDAIEFQVAQ
jgi:hypothetical protein